MIINNFTRKIHIAFEYPKIYELILKQEEINKEINKKINKQNKRSE